MEKLEPGMMKTNATIILIYAFAILSGGIVGWIKAKSLISLIMSSLFAVGLMITSYHTFKQKKSALYSASFLILLLVGVFSQRVITTQKFIPAGLMLLISAITVIALAYRTAKVTTES